MFSIKNRLLLEIILFVLVSIFYYRIISRYKSEVSDLKKELHALKTTQRMPPPGSMMPGGMMPGGMMPGGMMPGGMMPGGTSKRQTNGAEQLDEELTNELQELLQEETKKKVSVDTTKNQYHEPDSPDLSDVNHKKNVPSTNKPVPKPSMNIKTVLKKNTPLNNIKVDTKKSLKLDKPILL